MWVLSCCSCCSCRRCCCRLVTSAVDKRLLCTVHPILNVLWPPSQDISLALPPAPPGHQTPTSPRLHCMAHFATPLSCWRYYFCVAQFTALPGPGKQQKTSYTRARRNRWEGGGGRSGKVEKGREHCLDNYPCPLVWRRRLPTADPWPRLLSINNFSNKSWARTPQTE